MNETSLLKRLFSRPKSGPRELSGAQDRQVRKTAALCRALLSSRGEASGAALARDALTACRSLEDPARAAFFDLLADEFSPDPDEVGRAADAYRQDSSQQNLVSLLRVAEPPRQELVRRLNLAGGATAALVEMRRQVLQDLARNPQWTGLEADLTHLLSSWFNRGFLSLQRIDWHTSAAVLEKLIRYEAVHQIEGWRDLRRRLQADRRCYAFFHPALPEEPVIFIEVALTAGMSGKVQPLLDPDSPVFDPERADCAMFYSITNCQEGLRGISFGNFLIKQVAEDLGREFPRLKTFATLSPIPGFQKWLEAEAKQFASRAAGEPFSAIIARLDVPDWHTDKAAAAELQQPLMQLCAHYLLHAKQGEEPIDPVARFHLGNGARIERLNWLGDTSETGMHRAAGMMANYVYKLSEVESNHEAYASEHEVVASPRLEVLAMQSPLRRSIRAKE